MNKFTGILPTAVWVFHSLSVRLPLYSSYLLLCNLKIESKKFDFPAWSIHEESNKWQMAYLNKEESSFGDRFILKYEQCIVRQTRSCKLHEIKPPSWSQSWSMRYNCVADQQKESRIFAPIFYCLRTARNL